MTTQEDKSALLEIFQVIKSKIESEVSEINSIEIWNDQMGNQPNERARDYPYVGLEMSIAWNGPMAKTQLTDGSGLLLALQKGSATIMVHVCFDHLENETVSFEEQEPIRHKVFRAISMINDTDIIQGMSRVESSTPPSHDMLSDYPTIFTCSVQEFALIDEQQKVTATVDIQGSLDIDNDIIRTGNGEIEVGD